jgi:hypothetical protein
MPRRYFDCNIFSCKPRTGSAGIARPGPEAAGLAMTALTGPLLTDAARRRSSSPSHHRRLCCPAAQPVLRPPPTPTRPAIHLPGQPVIGRRTPAGDDELTNTEINRGLNSRSYLAAWTGYRKDSRFRSPRRTHSKLPATTDSARKTQTTIIETACQALTYEINRRHRGAF